MGERNGAMAQSSAACVCLLVAAQIGLASAGVISATVPDTISVAPTMNATSITACGVRVNWQVPASNGGKPILYYTIYATGGGTVHKKMAIVQGSATRTTFVTGLKRTTAYTFTVTTTNEIGESQKSPASISITSQNFRKYIFVSDFLNDRILRFDFATKSFMDVFVQKGSGGLRGPWGIAFNKYDDPAQPRCFLSALLMVILSSSTMHSLGLLSELMPLVSTHLGILSSDPRPLALPELQRTFSCQVSMRTPLSSSRTPL